MLSFKRLVQMIASLYGLFCAILPGDTSSVRWMSAPLTDYCEDDGPSFAYLRFTLYTLFSCNGSLISPTVLIALFTSADLKVDWTGFCLHSTQRINVGHFQWNDSQFQPMMVFLCMCPNDMNLQGDEKTSKIPQIIPQGKCFLEPLILISSMLPQISF